MIDESIGKILGMAMAYGASVLGMSVAYVNYRKRIVKADKIMTPAAWTVILLSILAVAGAVLAVVQLATAPPGTVAEEAAEAPFPSVEPAVSQHPARGEPGEVRSRWPLVGIVVPGLIFLFATWVTAALHRHFTTRSHSH
jgi:hypothetical protein